MTSLLWRQTGGVWPMGISCSVTWYDLGAIAYILQTAQIRLIVEIGVEHGGLAAWLTAYCAYTGCRYCGIDITLHALHAAVRGQIEERDAWSEPAVERVRHWMAETNGPALIICDGGDKPRELRLYAPLLRPGDVLLGHDYHNEYTDEIREGMPSTVEQIRTDWLDDTLLCMFMVRTA